jgi:lipopolysaccharide transport system ATP-binding protein
MSNIAIRVEGIGKRYRLGTGAKRSDSLRDAIVSAIKSPLRNLRDLRRLSRFDEEGDDVLWALREVSFEVRQGEVLGVVGRNGAGKSTLLKVLSRITEPTTGRAEVRGRIGALLEVGTGFHADLTGRQNIYLNGAILGMDREYIRRRFDEIVDFAGVERAIDTPVKRYSSGMYLRLAFAVAAHLEPEVLIVDEVLAVGDAEFQKKCIGKMGQVAREGRTVLFVSHNLAAVRSLCDSVMLLKDGWVESRGDPDAVIAGYLSEQIQSSSGESVWLDPETAPGDEDVRISAIRILNEMSIPVTEVGDAESMLIELRFEVLNELRNAQIGFQILTPDGLVVLESLHGDHIEVHPETHEGNVDTHRPGSYHWVCRIPAHFLNIGTYYVKLWGFIHNVRWLFPEEILLPFSVLPTKHLGGDHGYRRGIIRTRLEWENRGLVAAKGRRKAAGSVQGAR